MDAALLSKLNGLREARNAVAVVTALEAGNKRLVTKDAVGDDELADELRPRFSSGKSGIVEWNGADYFLQLYLPPPRLVIVGAVHISQALAPMAQTCDFDVTIIDPRTSFATPERFAGLKVFAEWPMDVLNSVPLDPYTAMVAVTHDPKIDDQPLQAALAANCFYVGALGSRKTHAKRVDRFMDAGFDRDDITRIDAPIGLDIGAANPAEIAVAVMGKIIEDLRRGAIA